MALKRIALRDFVIVRTLELDVSNGFTVLTGETGAGKSILVDAVQLALGARADAGVVREGSERAEIAVEFDADVTLDAWLETAGLDRGDSLLLRRTIDLQGRSRAWINGSPTTAAQLRDLGEQLLDIHGQHAWQSLTRPHAVRALLDAYAGVESQSLVVAWQAWRDAERRLGQAIEAHDSRLRERERLLWQLAEIEKLAPLAGEWDELQNQHSRLAHGQTLLDAAQQAVDLLEEHETSANARLARAIAVLRGQAHLETEFAGLAEILASSLAQTEDAVHSLQGYLRRIHLDPRQLETLDTRLSTWVALARRYKRVPEALPSLLHEWKEALLELDAASDIETLQLASQHAQAAYRTEALRVSRLRSEAAPRLAKSVTEAMQGLGMQGGQFKVALEPVDPPTASGLEEVAFLVAGHAGATARPVGKVASGGELSRIALAIAVTTSELGTAQTLIFDEVDAGVGGAVAETVGRLMKRLGRDRQVLAVTHLPQVAACADHHLVVAKQRDGAQTASSVTTAKDEQRVAEIARMLGGERLSGTTLAHARELLDTGTAVQRP